MKKQIIILLFGLITATAHSQNFVKITSPCNDALLQKTPGRWIKDKDLLYATSISKQQQQEILNRLDAIHQLVLKVYPLPMGVDAVWHRFTTDDEGFACQTKIDYTRDGAMRANKVNGIPIDNYNYTALFFPYTCGRNSYEMMTGWPGETGSFMHIYVNTLDNFFINNSLGELADVMQVDGRPIKSMPPGSGTLKGNQFYYAEKGSDKRVVLLHRDGILPFIPVTRKQYLDRCIEYIPKFYDPMIKGVESSPVRTLEEQEAEKNKTLDDYKKKYGSDPKKLKSATDYYLSVYQTDQQIRDEQLKNILKQKEDLLKHYTDELKATSEAKLLDSPAIIPLSLFNISDAPIFTTLEAGGQMLVTENPSYIRKDLPKYIPQFIVLEWNCSNKFSPQQNPCKAIDENFPIEKLQAMIDK